jgi:hypothetical protein
MPGMNGVNAASDPLRILGWAKPLESWDSWGVVLMFIGAGLGLAALVASLASAYVLYRVADRAQAELRTANEANGIHVAQANERAKALEVQVAQANALAETERLARVKIEEKLAPRTLTSEQRRSIVARIREHKGVSADLLMYGDAPEILLLGEAIGVVLAHAGWDVRGPWTTSGQLATGVNVGVDQRADSHHKAAAQALVEALRAERVHVDSFSFNDGEGWPNMTLGPLQGLERKRSAIRIIVGAKP